MEGDAERVEARWEPGTDACTVGCLFGAHAAIGGMFIIEQIAPGTWLAGTVASTILTAPLFHAASWRELAKRLILLTALIASAAVAYASVTWAATPVDLVLVAALTTSGVLGAMVVYAAPLVVVLRARWRRAPGDGVRVRLTMAAWLLVLAWVSVVTSASTQRGLVRLPFASGGATLVAQVLALVAAGALGVHAARDALRNGRKRRTALAALVGAGGLATGLTWLALAPRHPLTGVRSIHMSYYHTCAILQDGDVACWGDTRHTPAAPSFGNQLVAHRLAGAERARDLALGARFTCVLGEDGRVRCWGEVAQQRRAGEPLEGFLDIVEVAADRDMLCARSQGGDVSCIGGDSFFDELYMPSAKRIELSGPARDIAVGSGTACALVGDHVECWGSVCGDDFRGGYVPSTLTWTTFGGADTPKLISVAVGYRWVCAADEKGHVQCHQAREPRSPAKCATSGSLRFFGNERADQIAMAGSTLCGRRGAHVTCNLSPDHDPWDVAPPSVHTATDLALSAHGSNLCVVFANGEAGCVGDYNKWGQFGDGTRQQRRRPSRVLTGD